MKSKNLNSCFCPQMNNSYLKTLVLFFFKTFHLSSLFVLPSSVCVRVQKKHAFKQNQEEYKNPSFQARYNFRSEGGKTTYSWRFISLYVSCMCDKQNLSQMEAEQIRFVLKHKYFYNFLLFGGKKVFNVFW